VNLIFVFISLLFSANAYSADGCYGGIPKSNATIIENTGFTIGYSELRMNPLWVAYRVFHADNPVSSKRPSKFKVDNRTEAKVSHDDYTHSGYDRGHMAVNTDHQEPDIHHLG